MADNQDDAMQAGTLTVSRIIAALGTANRVSDEFWQASSTFLHRLDKEHQRDMHLNERLVNLIHGRAWLAEGRGQYAYNDGRYDDEVMCFVQQLLEVLPAGENQPIQAWMDKAERALAFQAAHSSDHTTLSRLRAALLERCRGCREGLAALVPSGGVDYLYHDFGPFPREDITKSMGYDLEDYERLARYQVCELTEAERAALLNESTNDPQEVK